MPFPPLDAWDDATLDDVCASDETAILEKKASLFFDTTTNAGKKKLTDEIAKQVSAFSNSGDGFLVFGVTDDGKLDDGVAGKVGNQPVKQWMEGLVPTLVEPTAAGIQARFLAKAGHHQPGFGVVAVHIPLSEARPHWVRGTRDAYLRVGEHSFPMPARTLLDMASRQGSSTGAIYDLSIEPSGRDNGSMFPDITYLRPSVGLVSGQVCKDWAVELFVDPDIGIFPSRPDGTTSPRDGTMFIVGQEPLFPGMRARVAAQRGVTLQTKGRSASVEVRVTFYAASAPPMTRVFPLTG